MCFQIPAIHYHSTSVFIPSRMAWRSVDFPSHSNDPLKKHAQTPRQLHSFCSLQFCRHSASKIWPMKLVQTLSFMRNCSVIFCKLYLYCIVIMNHSIRHFNSILISYFYNVIIMQCCHQIHMALSIAHMKLHVNRTVGCRDAGSDP